MQRKIDKLDQQQNRLLNMGRRQKKSIQFIVVHQKMCKLSISSFSFVCICGGGGSDSLGRRKNLFLIPLSIQSSFAQQKHEKRKSYDEDNIQRANNEPIHLSSVSSAFIILQENVYFGAKFNGHRISLTSHTVCVTQRFICHYLIVEASVYNKKLFGVLHVYAMSIWPHAELCNIFSFPRSLTSDQSVLS